MTKLQIVLRSLACTTLAGGFLLAASGCADNITYAQDSEKEGMRLYNQRQYAEAAGSFRNAVRQNPREYKADYYMGASYDAMGQYQEALQAYKAALDVMKTTLAGQVDRPFRARVIDALCTAISKSSDRDHELQILSERARKNQSAEDYLIAARVYRNTGDPDSALDAYNRGSLIDPKDFFLQKEYGLYLEQLGLGERAAVPLRKAYAIDNNDDQVNAALRRVGVIPGPTSK
jgi:tetratricopeptide (TPR) repeat protein